MPDWSQLNELCEMLGAEDCLALVDMFEEESAPILAAFRLGATHVSIVQDLHFIKGCALNLGLTKLAARCAELEAADKEGDLPNGSLEDFANRADACVIEARDLLKNGSLAKAL